MNKIFILLLIALIFVECKQKITNSAPINIIKIDSFDLKEKIDATELFDSCINIHLETTEKSLIGQIDKIQLFGDRLYILDTELAKSLIIFSKEGKFLFKIHNIGKGLGEFTTPDDFIIDNNKIYINCRLLQKLLVFDLNGEFIQEVPVPSISFSFSILNANTFLYSTCGVSDLNYHLIESNDKGEIIEKFLSYKTTNKNYPGCFLTSQGNFFKTKTGINFSMPFSDTIYEITSQNIAPKYFIDFTQYKLPESFIEKNNQNPQLASLLSSIPYAYGIGNVSENDEWVFLNFFLRIANYKLFYNKLAKELICVGYINNSFYLPFTEMVTISGDYFISITQPYQLLNKKWGHDSLGNEFSHTFESSILLENNITANDNPIIMLLKFKKRR